jgi:hypothetical protein
VLIFAKRGWALVQASRDAYEQWKKLPEADRERTRASAERMTSLSAELSSALGSRLVRKESGQREIDVITGELRAVITELAVGPAGELLFDTVGPKSMTARAAWKVTKFSHKQVSKRLGKGEPETLPAMIDPAGLRVGKLLEELRDQHRINLHKGTGLTNKHAKAKRRLVEMGRDAVVPLLSVLDAERPGTDTPGGMVEDALANDIADVLGQIGDPMAVGVLAAQALQHVVSAPRALAQFPEGLHALLNGLDNEDEFVRSCCIQGLASAAVERERAAAALATVALEDPSERIRAQAQRAHEQLG